MNVLQPTHPSFFPLPHHHHHDPIHNPISTTPPSNSRMASRKRKADDDDISMSVSPQNSPAMAVRSLARQTKKVKANEIAGRPLSLPRLLETLDTHSLKSVLQAVCDRHPEIGSEVVATAPKPSVSATLNVLQQYQERLRGAFPFGDDPGSDYAYNRVKQPLQELMDSLADFTPHYLPPNEIQASVSFSYLDGATKIVHEVPEWDSQSHQYHKVNAYDEISKAWALVITETLKRRGSFHLHTGGWDHKLMKHNEQSGGRMQIAVDALGSNPGWMGSNSNTTSSDLNSVRNELLSGRFGSNLPVSVGW